MSTVRSNAAQQHTIAEEQLAMVGQLVTTLQQVATSFQSSAPVAPTSALEKIENLRGTILQVRAFANDQKDLDEKKKTLEKADELERELSKFILDISLMLGLLGTPYQLQAIRAVDKELYRIS